MIIGHYGVAFAASGPKSRLPLWQAMIAVVWLDILHSSLEIAGVEKAAVLPGATAVVPIDLIYYPFSHSLGATLLWSALAFALYRLALGAPARVAGLVAACVASHFVLDVVAHRPDVPLWPLAPLEGDGAKAGFAMWNHVALTFIVETACLFIPLWWYSRATPGRHRGVLVLALLGTAFFFAFPYAPFPDDVRVLEAVALVFYGAVPLVGSLCEPRGLRVTAD